MTMTQFPNTRMRRLRQSSWIRDLVQEHHITSADLILPIFITEGEHNKEEIPSLPGVFRRSIDSASALMQEAKDLGIKAFALFPVTPADKKDNSGTEALNPDNLICRALSTLKNAHPDIGLIADIALDPYTTHGHDGLLKDGIIANDETIDILAQQAILCAQAGADIIAPSDMMDGRIGKIRQALEEKKHADTLILSYAAKFASHFYGPFRDAVGSSAALQGDKKTYQLNPTNAHEALRDAALDLNEGADILMIKPGLPYLDIIRDLKTETRAPIFAYHVSGEYAMLKAAAEKGWLDGDKTMLETMLSFKRAGADAILTYAALDVAKLLQA